jgi:hypothetical protein
MRIRRDTSEPEAVGMQLMRHDLGPARKIPHSIDSGFANPLKILGPSEFVWRRMHHEGPSAARPQPSLGISLAKHVLRQLEGTRRRKGKKMSFRPRGVRGRNSTGEKSFLDPSYPLGMTGSARHLALVASLRRNSGQASRESDPTPRCFQCPMTRSNTAGYSNC